MSKFGQNFDQIWSLSKFQNHSQVSTCYDQQNLNYGPKKLMQSRIIKIIQFFPSIFKTYRIIFLSTTHKQGTSQVKSMVMNYTVTHPVRLLTSRIHQEILVTLWAQTSYFKLTRPSTQYCLIIVSGSIPITRLASGVDILPQRGPNQIFSLFWMQADPHRSKCKLRLPQNAMQY